MSEHEKPKTPIRSDAVDRKKESAEVKSARPVVKTAVKPAVKTAKKPSPSEKIAVNDLDPDTDEKVTPESGLPPEQTFVPKELVEAGGVGVMLEPTATESMDIISSTVADVVAKAALGKPSINVEPESNPTPKEVVVEEEYTENHTLPSNFKFESTDRNKEGTMLVLQAYASGCLECTALVLDPDLPQSSSLPKCHFSLGNTNCPAASCRIEFVGEKVQFMNKWKRAKEKGDSTRVLRLMSELAERPSSFRDPIMKELGLL